MPTLRVRDTLSGELREVEPGVDGRIGVYACGPTVYSRIHVGNARPYVVFLLVRRLLAFLGHDVRLVVNVTDINDKIYDAARAAGVPSAEHAAEMTRLYREDTERLGLGRPDAEPLASETVPEIVELIAELIAAGHAYESGGDVYFSVRSFPGYGRLSNREPAEMDQGEEAGTASLKRDPLDFALWKARKPDEDTGWPSPWGEGRPGWHIECSAMAEKHLGRGFAIHGGGSDLVFPHHENEIAQSEAAHGAPFARVWMHNGMVRIADEKMSKSVGNIFQLAEALDAFGAPALVAYLVSGHYRQPLEFSDEALAAAAARVERIRNFLRAEHPPPGAEPDPRVVAAREGVVAALCDDFNTPRALATLFELIGTANRQALPGAVEAVRDLLPLLGLEGAAAEGGPEPGTEARELLAERERARAERDFARADELRERLGEMGWEVRDGPAGPQLLPRAR